MNATVTRSRTSFVSFVCSGGWYGREHKTMSFRASGHAVPLYALGATLHDPVLSGIEVAFFASRERLR